MTSARAAAGRAAAWGVSGGPAANTPSHLGEALRSDAHNLQIDASTLPTRCTLGTASSRKLQDAEIKASRVPRRTATIAISHIAAASRARPPPLLPLSDFRRRCMENKAELARDIRHVSVQNYIMYGILGAAECKGHRPIFSSAGIRPHSAESFGELL